MLYFFQMANTLKRKVFNFLIFVTIIWIIHLITDQPSWIIIVKNARSRYVAATTYASEFCYLSSGKTLLSSPTSLRFLCSPEIQTQKKCKSDLYPIYKYSKFLNLSLVENSSLIAAPVQQNIDHFTQEEINYDQFFELVINRTKLVKQSTILMLTENLELFNPTNIVKEHKFSRATEDILVPFRIFYPSRCWKGQNLPLLTTECAGRTGNIMGEYATLYALHKIFNAPSMLHPCFKLHLSNIFPNLSITEYLKVKNSEELSNWVFLAMEDNSVDLETGLDSYSKEERYNYRSFQLAAAGFLGPKKFVLGGTPFEIQLFNLYYEDLKRDFTFSDDLQRRAYEYLRNVSKSVNDMNENVTYIGFHVRRTDHIGQIKLLYNGTLPGNTYFRLALSYYRQKYVFPIFLVATDDVNFVKKSIIAKEKNVFISEGKTPSEDLAILTLCNHSIITTGSFGFWSGYLAGGEVVYPLDSSLKEFPYRINENPYFKLKLPNFTPIIF